MQSFSDWLFGAAGDLSRGQAMQWRADFVVLHGMSDAIIAVSFFAIPLGIIWYMRHRPGLWREYRTVAWLFCGFIFAAGAGHLLGLLTLWYPLHALHGVAKAATAVLCVAAIAVISPLLPALAGLPSSRQLTEVNERLRRGAAAHEATLRDLELSHHDLETRVEERTRELSLLMRELTHRSKNLLAVIQAMARQTARHAGTTENFLDQFGARLAALAASHDLLVQEGWHGASLSELVHSQLGHYLDRQGAQVTVEGPALLLKPEAAQSIGLAIHELAANAAKYGGLSVPAGRVSIAWRMLPDAEGDGVEIVWSESGGPQVAKPQRRGFGSLVVERNLARTLEADITLEFPPEGARCRMIIPATNLAVGH